jgi:hypothetical protein
MTEPIVILVPVLRRPWRVQPLIDSIETATPEAHRTLFIVNDDDEHELDALKDAGADFLTVDGSRALVRVQDQRRVSRHQRAAAVHGRRRSALPARLVPPSASTADRDRARGRHERHLQPAGDDRRPLDAQPRAPLLHPMSRASSTSRTPSCTRDTPRVLPTTSSSRPPWPAACTPTPSTRSSSTSTRCGKAATTTPTGSAGPTATGKRLFLSARLWAVEDERSCAVAGGRRHRVYGGVDAVLHPQAAQDITVDWICFTDNPNLRRRRRGKSSTPRPGTSIRAWPRRSTRPPRRRLPRRRVDRRLAWRSRRGRSSVKRSRPAVTASPSSSIPGVAASTPRPTRPSASEGQGGKYESQPLSSRSPTTAPKAIPSTAGCTRAVSSPGTSPTRKRSSSAGNGSPRT